VRTFIRDVPLSVVALTIALVFAIVLSPTIARWTQASRLVSALLLLGFGFVLAATITPTAAAIDGATSDGVCHIASIDIVRPDELLRASGASLNVLLFVPLGIALGMLPRTRAAGVSTLAAIALPFAVETVQFLLTPLGRSCQATDVFYNLMGLAIGVVAGSLFRLVRARWPRRHA
jgi:glycopeptide antibiotics resistance protein